MNNEVSENNKIFSDLDDTDVMLICNKLSTNVNLLDINDIIFFQHIGDLLVRCEVGEDSSQFEDDFESWMQIIDSNQIIFGYIQYLEKCYCVLKNYFLEGEIINMVKSILNLNKEQLIHIPDPYNIYKMVSHCTTDSQTLVNYSKHLSVFKHLVLIAKNK